MVAALFSNSVLHPGPGRRASSLTLRDWLPGVIPKLALFSITQGISTAQRIAEELVTVTTGRSHIALDAARSLNFLLHWAVRGVSTSCTAFKLLVTMANFLWRRWPSMPLVISMARPWLVVMDPAVTPFPMVAVRFSN